MEGILPDEVLRQPKAGFAAPVDYWLANDFEAWWTTCFPNPGRQRGLFQPERLVGLSTNTAAVAETGRCRFGNS